MKQKLLNKLWLRVGMIVAIMTTALSGTAWAEVETIWSENFDGLSANATPTSPTNSSYTGVTYTCTNGTGTSPGATKIYNEATAGGTAPELLVGKKGSGTGAAGGKFTAVIPLDNFEGTLTLTYYQNKQSLKVSSTTSGVSGGQTLKPSAVGQQTTSFTGITSSMTSITIVFEATTTNNVRLDNIVLTGTKASSTPACATPTFSPAAGAYTSAQSVTISSETSDATIYYTTDGTDPTTSSSTYTSAISVSTNTTIKAMAVKAGMDNSSVASAKYVFTENAGTADNPYTVAEARALIDAGVGTQNVYVAGIVSEIVTAYNSQYGNISFNISDDGETSSDQLEVFRCVSSTDADASEVIVNDNVVVKGNLKKYNSTYEFDAACTLESLTHPAVPTIIVGPTTLANFTYEVGDGPSTATNIAVSGLNLTTDITLSLGESSNFEMSLAEASGYTNSLTLPQTSGDVAETTIYVRLKAGLNAAAYEGTITISSTDATSQTVSLSGSVTAPEAPNVTWDLSTNSYDSNPTQNLITWSSSYATMTNAKGTSGTAVNNYIPTTRTSTRMYSGNVLTITPASGYAITSVVFTATTEGYASALQGSNWTNAAATASESTVTVTPADGSTAISAAIGGTCGFTEVKVYYETYVAPAAAPVWSDLPTPIIYTGAEYELDLTAYVTGNPDPSISLTSSSAAANDYTFTDGQLSFTPSSAGTYTFSFTATNTEGSANATLTVTAESPEGTPYTLATTITSGKHYVIAATTNAGTHAMAGKHVDKSYYDAVDATLSGNTLYVTISSGAREFIIYGPDADGNYSIYDPVEEGYLCASSSSSNDMSVQTTNNANGKWKIDFENETVIAQGTYTRNEMQYNSGSPRFSCYASGQTAVKFYEKDGEATPTESKTLNASGYATYCSENALDFTGNSDVTAWVITAANSTTGVITFSQIEGKVPAGTGMLLKGSASASVNITSATGTVAAPSSNLLEGTLASKEVAADEYYGLSGNEFVKVNAGTVPAGKALLPASALGSNVKAFTFVFEDDATGISLMEDGRSQMEDGVIYNLAGQRISKMQKGINIVNGKKIAVK